MITTILNPENLKIGTQIKTIHGTFTVYKKYKQSLLCEVDWQTERIFIDFKMFKNRYWMAELVEVVEPEFEIIHSEELPEGFSIGVEEGMIEIF